MLKKIPLVLGVLAIMSYSEIASARFIQKIEFTGIERVSKETAMSYLSVHEGQNISKSQIRKIIK